MAQGARELDLRSRAEDARPSGADRGRGEPRARGSGARQLKLVVRLELRGRGDVQVFRVRLPGPEMTKGEPDDARVEVVDSPLPLQQAGRRRARSGLARGLRARRDQGRRATPTIRKLIGHGDRAPHGAHAAEEGALAAHDSDRSMSDTETHELITDQAGREASGAHRYGRYLEEFEVGAVYKHWPAKTVTEAEDHLFCLLTMNHHPLHVNDVYASQSQQGRTSSPARSSTRWSSDDGRRRLRQGDRQPGDRRAQPPGAGLPRRHPVRRVRGARGAASAVEARPGVVRVHTRAYKQDGTLVAEFKRAVLVPRSPEAIEGE